MIKNIKPTWLVLAFLLLSSSLEECKKPVVANYTIAPVLLVKNAKIDCPCQHCDGLDGRITWKRDNVNIDNDPEFAGLAKLANHNQTLIFGYADRALVGEYKCYVTNNCGSAAMPPVRVFYPEQVEQINSKIVYKLEGDPYMIECNQSLLRNVPASVIYSVKKMGAEPDPNRVISVDGKLVFSYLTALDSAFYRCQAAVADSASTVMFYTEFFALYVKQQDNRTPFGPITVYPPPDDSHVRLRAGDPLCAFYGNPTPQVGYYDNNQREIEPDSISFGMSYFCLGKNFVGSVWAKFTVENAVPPKGSIVPYDQAVTDGDVRTFSFRGSFENGEITVSWFFGDSMLRIREMDAGTRSLISESNGSVQINFTTKNGPYKIVCVASNRYGTFLTERSFKILPKKIAVGSESVVESGGSMSIMLVVIFLSLCTFSFILMVYVNKRTRRNKVRKVKKMIKDHERLGHISEFIPIVDPFMKNQSSIINFNKQNNSIFI